MVSKETTLRIIDSLTDLQTLPDKKIDGVDCFHYLGTVDRTEMVAQEQARLAEMQSRMDPDDYDPMQKSIADLLTINTEVELWIGKSDNLIRQMIQTTQFQNDEGQLQALSTTSTFYDSNKLIIIEPPLDAEGYLLTGWQLAGSIAPDSAQPVFSRNFTSSIGAQEG